MTNRFTRALAGTAARLRSRPYTVTAVEQVGAHRSIELTGDALRRAAWQAGDEVQIRADPDGFAVRTYAPMSWDRGRGATRLLAYAHGDGPGATWVRTVRVGETGQLVGPRRSVVLADLGERPVLFAGDETSFATVAAWRNERPGREPLAVVLEVTDAGESRTTLERIRVPGAWLIERDGTGRHLEELSEAIIDGLRTHPDAALCLTGLAQTIASVRHHLRRAGLGNRPTRVKPYWDLHRGGLD